MAVKAPLRWWRSRLIWSLIAGVVTVHAVVLYLVREAPPDPVLPERERPRVTVTPAGGSGSGVLVQEQIELFDPEPLFLPTRWNAGADPLPAALRRQPGGGQGYFEPRFAFAPDRLDPVFGPPERAPANATRALAGIAAGWDAFGGADRPATPMPGRMAGIEIRQVGDGRIVVARDVQVAAGFEAGRDWEPAEFSVAVAAGGLVGEPSLLVSSRQEAVDAFWRRFLVENFRLGERLDPGFYRVVVGP